MSKEKYVLTLVVNIHGATKEEVENIARELKDDEDFESLFEQGPRHFAAVVGTSIEMSSERQEIGVCDE